MNIRERMRRSARAEVLPPPPEYNPEEGDTFASPETDPIIGRPRQYSAPMMDFTRPPDLASAREREANPEALSKYDYADQANFDTLIAGIHDDPAGRGPTPALGPVHARAAGFDDPQTAALRPPGGMPARAAAAPPPKAAPPAPPPGARPAQGQGVNAGQEPPPALWSIAKTVPNSLLALSAAFGKHGRKKKVQEAVQGLGRQNMDMVTADNQARSDFARRKAALERAAGRESKLDARHADETAYNRGRDAKQDAIQADDRAYTRGRNAVGDAREQARFEQWLSEQSPETRAKRREEAFADFQRETTFGTDEDIRKAKALRRMKGAGGAGGNADQAYAAAFRTLSEQYGGPEKIPKPELARLEQLRLTKDPAKEYAAHTKEIAGRIEKRQGAQGKTKAAAEAANSTLAEIRRLKGIAQGMKARGVKYIAGKEPYASPQGIKNRLQRGKAMLFGDEQRGSTGLTPEEADLSSSGKLVASSLYFTRAHNAANLMAEQEKAEATITNDGTIEGHIRALEVAERQLQEAINSGRVLARDERGNIIQDDPVEDAEDAVADDGDRIKVIQ